MLSMAGIRDVQWYWAHVGAVWLFSFIMYFAMYHSYKTFLRFRIKYFESETYQEEMASRTLMLAGLPSSLQSDDKLFKFMNDMGLQDKPVQALVGRKVDKLPELMEKHKKMVKSLEKVVAKYYADPNRLPSTRPTVSVGGLCSSKVDAIDYYSQQIEQLTDQIERTRMQVNKSQPTNYGFVSYDTIHAAHRVAKELSSSIALRKRSKMIDPPEIFLSPVPRDIIWFNVANPKQLRKSRKVIVNTAFVIFSLLFYIPMGFLTTIAKLDSIIGIFPDSRKYFVDHPFVAGMLQSLLPVLFMDILFLLVRKFIVYLAWFQGNITKSSRDRSTLAKFYLFFTLNNLIVFAIAGTILNFFMQIKTFLMTLSFSWGSWSAIKGFLDPKNNIVQLLSQNVIGTSLFWVNYISLRNFGALLDLSQIVSLILYWAKTTVTPRESKNLNKPDVFDFPTFFSAHMFLLTVALLYSVVAPLVLFFAAIYFSLASLVYKYQLMYVFRTKVETGGRLFRVVYNRVLTALILFQVVMIGILNLKMAHQHSLAVLPLPILTLLFKLFLTKSYDTKIDFYDYGSARDERHLFKNNKGNLLLMNFENPALKSRVVSTLVPDAAKKMLSNKVLNGPSSKEGKKSGGRPGGHGRVPSRGKTSFHSQRDADADTDAKSNKHESYEMGHVSKASEKFNDHKQSYDAPRRALSPQRQQRYDHNAPQHVLGHDDSVDDYYDDQKESLTKSFTQRYGDTYSTHSSQRSSQPPTAKVHGAQDMTSFVAGRYRADRSVDPYNYSSNSQSTGSKPSYMELAKVHQTDSYKSTGKAMQYEEKRGLHLPPLKSPAKTRQQSSTRRAKDSQPQEYVKGDHQQSFNSDSIYEARPSTPTTPQPSRLALAHHLSNDSSTPSSGARRGGYKDVPVLQHTSSSPALHNNKQDSNDAIESYTTPNVKAMARAMTQGNVHQNTKYAYDNSNSTARSKSYGNHSIRQQHQDTNV
ncbi:hypothetical protein EDD11_007119 [Mortierella claussenii]|nr:hypothetical protein EDD11_007119 [Mortierella claussenii]